MGPFQNDPTQQDARSKEQFIEYESKRPRSVTEPRITAPTLIILLGSTPALAALEAMRLMLALSAEDRHKVAFLFIDTDEVPPDLVAFRQKYSGYFQEFKLRIAVPGGIDHAARINQGPIGGEYNEQFTFINDFVPQFFATGAGGVRSNGHVAACFNYPYIENSIEQAIAAISKIGLNEGARQPSEIQVNIVAFLGGGTGSAIMPDIAVSVRQRLLKMAAGTQQRINLFCMLPEQIPGVDTNDVSWRRSNSTAALLEVIALSLAPKASNPPGTYMKWMRDSQLQVPNTTIANEVYLIGQSGMGVVSGAARLVGLDLFQRITDASGVGFLERSKGVDRRTLGTLDEFNLPNIFSTNCPVDVAFMANEMSTAFAHLATAKLLPILAAFNPHQRFNPPNLEQLRAKWREDWKKVARPSDVKTPVSVTPLKKFTMDEFDGVNRGDLEILWNRLKKDEDRYENDTRAVIATKYAEERLRIATTTGGGSQGPGVGAHFLHLLELEAEYSTALATLQEGKAVDAPVGPPTNAESQLLREPPPWIAIFSNWKQNYQQSNATEVYAAYNDHLNRFAAITRRNHLEGLLTSLLAIVQEQKKAIMTWAESAEVSKTASDFETQAKESMAWQGRLEEPHPHQRHVFDLHTLRTTAGANVAVERLYEWATRSDQSGATTPAAGLLDYSSFVDKCLRYLSLQSATLTGQNAIKDPLDVGPRYLAERVADYFYDYYMKKFQDVNIFELFKLAAPPSPDGQTREQQIVGYLVQHLQHIRGVLRPLIAFEPQVSPQGPTMLNTSVYLGMHWRDGAQKALLDQALRDVGPITPNNNTAFPSTSIDPHRLQISFGQHAFSLSVVRDFYMDQSSFMADYLMHQRFWVNQSGSPVHASGEMQRLVTEEKALPYYNRDTGQPIEKPLYERVIRRPFQSTQGTARGTFRNNGGRGSGSGMLGQ